MKPIIIPETYNYIGAFLTMRCNLSCSYCINQFNNKKIIGAEMSGEDWIRGLSRIVTRKDLPITLQGGEPTLHRDFYSIVNRVRWCGDGYNAINLDLMTNCSFDNNQFMENIGPNVFKRKAPYASIRVSYHPEQMKLGHLLTKVIPLQHVGYSIGVWMVNHPKYQEERELAEKVCKDAGIDFRLKEFLGEYNGKIYGNYKYPAAINNGECTSRVKCKTTELLIGPDGNIYRCHSDLYSNRDHIGHILDDNFEIKDEYRSCSQYGHCNPCDVKIKTNRFQEFGHTSVDIV